MEHRSCFKNAWRTFKTTEVEPQQTCMLQRKKGSTTYVENTSMANELNERGYKRQGSFLLYVEDLP